MHCNYIKWTACHDTGHKCTKFIESIAALDRGKPNFLRSSNTFQLSRMSSTELLEIKPIAILTYRALYRLQRDG